VNATIIAPSRPPISTQIFAAPRKNNSSQRTRPKSTSRSPLTLRDASCTIT